MDDRWLLEPERMDNSTVGGGGASSEILQRSQRVAGLSCNGLRVYYRKRVV